MIGARETENNIGYGFSEWYLEVMATCYPGVPEFAVDKPRGAYPWKMRFLFENVVNFAQNVRTSFPRPILLGNDKFTLKR